MYYISTNIIIQYILYCIINLYINNMLNVNHVFYDQKSKYGTTIWTIGHTVNCIVNYTLCLPNRNYFFNKYLHLKLT